MEALRSNIWKIYAFGIALSSMGFGIPVIVIFWQEKGLSLSDITLLQSIFAVALVLLEIPSGYFADLVGRKQALVVAGISVVLGTLTFLLSDGFKTFLLAELFFALALSFQSGANSALLYDTLLSLNETDRFQKIWGNKVSLTMVGAVISTLIGGYVASFDLAYPFLLAFVISIMSIPLSLFMIEPTRKKLMIKSGYLKELILVIREKMKDKNIRWFFFYTAILLSFLHSPLWFYQPYFKLIKIDLIYFGGLLAGCNVISAISANYAHKIKNVAGEKVIFGSLLILLLLSYFLMGSILFLWSFLFIAFQQITRGLYQVYVADYIHRSTDSKIRATIASAQSLISRMFYALIIPLMGVSADTMGIPATFNVFGTLLLLIGPIAFWKWYSAKNS